MQSVRVVSEEWGVCVISDSEPKPSSGSRTDEYQSFLHECLYLESEGGLDSRAKRPRPGTLRPHSLKSHATVIWMRFPWG